MGDLDRAIAAGAWKSNWPGAEQRKASGGWEARPTVQMSLRASRMQVGQARSLRMTEVQGPFTQPKVK